MIHLPELCLEQVFRELDNDVETLHSCILVNRLWFALAISELWKNPFDTIQSGNQKNQKRHRSLVDVYISCLPKDIRDNIYSGTTRSPIFNYVKYLRYIDIAPISKSVNKWIVSKKVEELPLFKHLHVTCKRSITRDYETAIVETLCDYFISCSIRIDEIDLSCRLFNLFDHPFANPNLSRIKTFRCSVMYLPDLMEAGIFKSASKIAKDIQYLEIRFICSYNNYSSNSKNSPVKDVTGLIESQKNLKHILLQCTSVEFPMLLASLCTHTITLTHIELYRIVYGCGFPLCYLAKLENLQHFQLEGCSFTGSSNKNVDVSSFRRLKSLIVKTTNIQTDILEIFIRQANNSIRLLEIRDFRDLRELICSCKNYCTLLTKLVVSINQGTLLPIISMVTTCRNLEEIQIYDETMKDGGFYLPSDAFDVNCKHTADEFICQLGSALPDTVHTIRLIMDWVYRTSSLDFFFKQCNAKKLKKLEFSNCSFFSS
ncbi:hypothetical protein C1645_770211, partial [Glomus cerebriforme]